MKITKSAMFILVLFIIYLGVSSVLVDSEVNLGHHPYHFIYDFYDEPKGSLDAVYIGSSVVYSTWVAPIAWKEYGIKVWPYASSGQSIMMARSIIENARHYQPDALYIVNVRMVQPTTLDVAHWLTDYIPNSVNKVTLQEDICRAAGFNFEESTEVLLPIVRFHDRWNRISAKDFHHDINGLKAGNYASYYLQEKMGEPIEFHTTDVRAELKDGVQGEVIRLLDYCEDNHIKVLFVISPHCNDESSNEGINTVKDIIEERGFEVLDMFEHLEEIGIEVL